MSTRLSVDLIFLGLIAAVANWIAHAPADPPARAAYLCTPVIVVAGAAAHLEAAMDDDGRTVAPTPPWRFDPGRACLRVITSLSEDLGY